MWEMILPSLLLLLSGQSLGWLGVKRGDDDFYEKSCNLPISHVLGASGLWKLAMSGQSLG